MIIHFKEGHPFTDEQLVEFMRWFDRVAPVNSSDAPSYYDGHKWIPLNAQQNGWQCPVCGVGVHPDSKVCPNCVKSKKSKTEIKE
jgi:rubrerythrin